MRISRKIVKAIADDLLKFNISNGQQGLRHQGTYVMATDFMRWAIEAGLQDHMPRSMLEDGKKLLGNRCVEANGNHEGEHEDWISASEAHSLYKNALESLDADRELSSEIISKRLSRARTDKKIKAEGKGRGTRYEPSSLINFINTERSKVVDKRNVRK